MVTSVFDLFSVGIGPSSSHTVGPMRAANMFVRELQTSGRLHEVRRIKAELFGSLGATGHGHGSTGAVVAGLFGEDPETVEPDWVLGVLEQVRSTGRVLAAGEHGLAFDVDEDLVMHRRATLPGHPNGMQFSAWFGEPGTGAEAGLAADAEPDLVKTYYSVGGGFVLEPDADGVPRAVADPVEVPWDFHTAVELLEVCQASGLSISGVVMANEQAIARSRGQDDSPEAIRAGVMRLWRVMQDCVDHGCATEGTLPGGLKVPRRAPGLAAKLHANPYSTDPLRVVDWVNLFALAVNEENAAGGRVVTAPTNGAAGIIPAVLHYYSRFVPGASDDGVVCFLLTATAIGTLYQKNASISGAEVGCQGEVGSACSMASGALCEVLGGTPEQVENAAEIGMEHNLGLTCDPIGGLVQIPCIERNAMASVKAINAARLALAGDGGHIVGLDKVIKTMRQTGKDMKVKYKETSRGGLAVNVIEC